MTHTPQLDYIKCPLHRYTFKVKNIREWVERTAEGKTLNLFAGYTKLNIEVTIYYFPHVFITHYQSLTIQITEKRTLYEIL